MPNEIINNKFKTKIEFLIFLILVPIGAALLSAYLPEITKFNYTSGWYDLNEEEYYLRVILIALKSGILQSLFGLIFTGAGIYITSDKHEKKVNNLEKIIKENINYYQEKLADLNNKIYSLHQQTPDIWLKMMFDKFDFSSSERVSIYFFHEKQFHLLSRHSGNPNFKETHKPILKKDEGILHWIWSNGKAKDEKCPSSKDIKKYIKHQQDNYKYDENRINEMTMKSCRYLGVRIDDNRDAKGLILVESLNEEFFTSEIHNENAIMEYIKKYQSYLTEFVNTGIAYQIERQKLNSNEGQNTPEKNMKEILGLK